MAKYGSFAQTLKYYTSVDTVKQTCQIRSADNDTVLAETDNLTGALEFVRIVRELNTRDLVDVVPVSW